MTRNAESCPVAKGHRSLHFSRLFFNHVLRGTIVKTTGFVQHEDEASVFLKPQECVSNDENPFSGQVNMLETVKLR